MQPTETPRIDRGVVVSVFHDRMDAARAVAELQRLGVADDHIGMIARNGDSMSGTTGSQWEAGAAAGAIAGGATGTALGLAVTAGLIPGVGPVVAGGLLAGIAASAAAGAAAGGILGGLIGLGLPEEEAVFYHGEFEAGRTIVTVNAGDKADIARSILLRCGGSDSFGQPSGKPAEVEMADVGGDHVRTDAARRMNEGVEEMSSAYMPPGV
jgi:hypothetical protein